VVGYLASSRQVGPFVTAFRRGLSEFGYAEGSNITIEYRSAEGQFDRLPALAAELVQRHVAAIVAPDGTPPALAAKAASNTIPIVFIVGKDPVASGLVASLARPGGNITGLVVLTAGLTAKRFGLLYRLAPTATSIALLVNPASAAAEGAKVEALPAMQPTKFTLVINLKTAKALGLKIPSELLALADSVIE
jgi:putative tryptophan/tyrosine transport system substrate-binding protein